MKKTGIPLVLLSLFLGTAAFAKDEVKNPHWLSDADVQAIVAMEPPPPAAGSDAEKADLQEEIEAQKARTPERIAEANRDASYSIRLFTDMVGPRVTEAKDPVTFHFFAELNQQIAQVVHESKAHWHRPRPYLAHPEVIHPLFHAGDYSYPSGHSTHSYAFAIILGQIFPDRAQAFMERARKIAQSRVDAGVHYTSDINEGRIVGDEIAKELLAKDDFQKAMKAAKAEVAGRK